VPDTRSAVTYVQSKKKTRTTRKQKSSYIDRFIQSIF
jgi:hypothetical protein